MYPDLASRLDSKTDPFELWKSLDFWREQSLDLIPLVIALAVTKRMGINGWMAIPAYLMTVNSSRHLMRYLSSTSSPTGLTLDNPIVADRSIAYTVVHAIPRRIRLRVPLLAQDVAYGRRLEKLLKTDAQVTDVRLNYQTASLAIAYKSPEISLSYWLEILESGVRSQESE